MIKGIGVDIVNLERISLEKDLFAKKILSEKEYQIYIALSSIKRKKEFLGGRFAGKEAFLKANGKGIGEISFQDIEILNEPSGKPYLNVPHAFISISHETSYAIAYVVIEGC